MNDLKDLSSSLKSLTIKELNELSNVFSTEYGIGRHYTRVTPQHEDPIMKDNDVLIIGSGSSGVSDLIEHRKLNNDIQIVCDNFENLSDIELSQEDKAFNKFLNRLSNEKIKYRNSECFEATKLVSAEVPNGYLGGLSKYTNYGSSKHAKARELRFNARQKKKRK